MRTARSSPFAREPFTIGIPGEARASPEKRRRRKEKTMMFIACTPVVILPTGNC
jgi:hypothetical protein